MNVKRKCSIQNCSIVDPKAAIFSWNATVPEDFEFAAGSFPLLSDDSQPSSGFRPTGLESERVFERPLEAMQGLPLPRLLGDLRLRVSVHESDDRPADVLVPESHRRPDARRRAARFPGEELEAERGKETHVETRQQAIYRGAFARAGDSTSSIPAFPAW